MLLKLERFSYSKTETEGVLTLPDGTTFATVERPWIPNPNGAQGGAPEISCIPDGLYQFEPHTSKSKGEVYIISAPSNGVYKWPQEHKKDHGRDVIYMHVANWPWQVKGCIAPGVTRRPMKHPQRDQVEQAVSLSGTAMAVLRKKLGRKDNHLLLITAKQGAVDEANKGKV